MSRQTDQHSSPTSSTSSPTNLMTPSPTLSFTTLSAAHQHAFMNSARVQASQPQQAAPAPARQTQQSVPANNNGGAGSKVKTAKSRKRVNTAEKRATHNAVERQRREALNGRFLDLARLLPGLAAVRRPSKSNIVNNSISHLSAQRGYRLAAARELRTLLAERDALLSEVNDWRSRNGVEARESTGVTAAVEGVLKVEEETFGVFTAGFGPDGDDDDEDGMDGEGSFDGGASVMDRTSFSSDASNLTGSAFAQAYNGHQAFNGTSAAAAIVASNLSNHMNGTLFGNGNVKTEAISPASDGSSPRSSAAHGGFHVEGSSPHDAEKVTSWAAEQLLAHLRHQQRQAEDEQLSQHRDRSDSVGSHHSIPLANAHHGSNPFTANLLATIAAQQQRSSFDMGTHFNERSDSPKAYSFPAGAPHLGYPGFLHAQQAAQQQQQQPAHASLDAWRSYALQQYNQQPAAFQQQHHAQGGRGEPSLDDITAAVRVGMGYGLGMTLGGPASQQTSLWGMTPEADSFSA